MHACMLSHFSRVRFWDSRDCSPPGSSALGILQARILKWVGIPFSKGFPNPGIEPTSLMPPALAGRFFATSITWEALWWGVQFSSAHSLSHVWLFVTSWTAAVQASLSITNFQSLLKLMSIMLVMPSNYIILCHPLLLLPSVFLSIRVFSNESVLHIRRPK